MYQGRYVKTASIVAGSRVKPHIGRMINRIQKPRLSTFTWCKYLFCYTLAGREEGDQQDGQLNSRHERMCGPVSQATVRDSANEGGSIGPASARTSRVNKISVTHGLILSAIELALTVSNVINEDALQLSSFSDMIFGGSAVIEAVGFLFAIGMSVRVLLYPFEKNVVGVGVPVMVIAEGLAVAESVRDMDGVWAIGRFGLGVQSLCFLTFGAVSLNISPASKPSMSSLVPILLGIFSTVALHLCRIRSRQSFSLSDLLVAVLIAVPLVVEISESALLFSSGSLPFESYLLAVLDVLIITPVAAFYVLSLVSSLFERR